ncbi:hypothetical protein [Cryptosporangium phraense]|uniref:Uncharacterized protein n=1 Tax=Cryptosporangium phraense TaxID=2593070 RepID=A0A545ANF6_9ACTN|nr:hypothetical protein [Cryptosporangium phraense]TQS42800.1 hypothetical protein FL583_22340 [Cryptosporangium phraense]
MAWSYAMTHRLRPQAGECISTNHQNTTPEGRQWVCAEYRWALRVMSSEGAVIVADDQDMTSASDSVPTLPEFGKVDPSNIRRAMAPRLKWPQGVVEECERVERLRPDWSVFYITTNFGLAGAPVGYRATLNGTSHRSDARFVSAETPDELLAAIDAVEREC